MQKKTIKAKKTNRHTETQSYHNIYILKKIMITKLLI